VTTNIEWVARPGTTPESWNPVAGCSKVSEGCANCYAERMARRLKAMGVPQYRDVVDEDGWTGEIVTVPSQLEKPLRWREPRTVFACSMSDLFHPDVPEDWIWSVIEVMWKADRHTFMLLTKRAARMVDVLSHSMWFLNEPPQNIWLGVTAENQTQANMRVQTLLELRNTAVLFASLEPLLEEVDLWPNLIPIRRLGGPDHVSLDWVIVGGESGPGARRCDPAWVRRVLEDCEIASVPAFVKQMGSTWAREQGLRGKGGDPAEWPDGLKKRRWPR